MDSSTPQKGITELGTYEEVPHVSHANDEYGAMGPAQKAVRFLANACYLVFAIMSIVVDVLLFKLAILLVSILPISKDWKTAFCRGAKVVAHHGVVSLFGFWMPHAIFIRYSDEILEHRRNIVISNHCSDYDGIFISSLMIHLKKLSGIYIVMKDALRRIPVVGSIMEAFGYAFLARRRVDVSSAHGPNTADLGALGQLVDSANGRDSYEILLFPEGTYPTSRAIRSAKTYAKEKKMMHDGKPYVPELTLVPKKGGFNFMKDRLYDLEGVVDITTLMNPYIRRPREEFSLVDLIVYGSHRFSQAFIISYVPKESIDDEFLQKTFCRKDKIIQQYVEEMTAGDDRTVPASIRDISHFREILEKIDPASPNDRIEMIRMHSPYRIPILLVAPLVVCALAYATPRLLHMVCRSASVLLNKA